MRNRYRESTAAILGSLSHGPANCESCAQACGLHVNNTATLLLRLSRMGHVSRERTQQGTVVIDQEEGISRPRWVYVYTLTPKGLARYKYLKSLSGRPLRNR